MASSPKFISILFLLTFFSIQIHAREFFNKVSSVNDNNNRDREEPVTVPTTQQANTFNFQAQRQEQEPSFYAQTESGYGLYGSKSDQLPSESTATTTSKVTYKPYVTPVRYHPDEPYNALANNNNNNNNKAYKNEQQNFGEARFAERSNYYNTKNGNDNAERQGMSDTRFLENGKYFVDINNERNSDNYPDSFKNSRSVPARHVEYYNNGGAGGGYYGNLQGRNNYQNEDFEEEQYDEP